MAKPEQSVSMDGISGERRESRRYRIVLDLRWSVVRRRKVLASGAGRTLDLSSSGLLFDAGRPLPVGSRVELSIAWPALLYKTTSIQLMVYGRIIRADGSRNAVLMVRHEFRTASTRDPLARPASR